MKHARVTYFTRIPSRLQIVRECDYGTFVTSSESPLVFGTLEAQELMHGAKRLAILNRNADARSSVR